MSVNFADIITTDIDATSPSDYKTYASVITIPAGVSSTQIAIPIQNDDVYEPHIECFNVSIRIDNDDLCSATVLIKDDDGMLILLNNKIGGSLWYHFRRR